MEQKDAGEGQTRTADELEAELAETKAELARQLDRAGKAVDLYNEIVAENARLVRLMDDDRQRGRKLTVKQEVVRQFAMSSWGAFPHLFCVKARWDRAERLYEEGVRRGHLPKEPG